jgi:antitoxin PrlF
MSTAPRLTSRLSSRSRVVVPRAIRERLRIGPGDAIVFEERGGDVVIRSVKQSPRADPFAAFSEWSSDADEDAYRDL